MSNWMPLPPGQCHSIPINNSKRFSLSAAKKKTDEEIQKMLPPSNKSTAFPAFNKKENHGSASPNNEPIIRLKRSCHFSTHANSDGIANEEKP